MGPEEVPKLERMRSRNGCMLSHGAIMKMNVRENLEKHTKMKSKGNYVLLH